MDSAFVRSFPNAPSLTTGGNLRHTKNIYYANCYVPKVLEHKSKTQIEHKFWRLRQPSLNHHYQCTGWGSTYQERSRKYDVKATPEPSFDSKRSASDSKNILDCVKSFLTAFYKLSIPVATITRILSIISASLLAVEKLSDISPIFFIGVLQVMVPHLFMDIYINGVNQLFDIEIDKINKPYLPLASGEISYKTGVIVVASSLTLSLCFGWIIGSWPLIWGLLSCFLIWTAYSIDTFVFKKPVVFPRSLVFVVVFISFYFVGMALYKDIPDIEGDKTYGINSLPTRIGLKRAFWISISLLEIPFGVALLAGATSSSHLWIKIITGFGHAALASLLWYKAKSVDLKSKASIASFYIFIWKVLSMEYFLMPFIR
ncbi:glycinol 4-dimethylallyltransferase isoform X2 [Cajanus cajan]|uniref:glycinol 4-dimethylallyltransferase isoform X2 n=1 Tax=Cajanus cajan TaxID=3821 RepID=UPI0010FBB1E2|nr:glycinol 4-dimethylallyltransferase isoform X2 [Cajanus cajan]